MILLNSIDFVTGTASATASPLDYNVPSSSQRLCRSSSKSAAAGRKSTKEAATRMSIIINEQITGSPSRRRRHRRRGRAVPLLITPYTKAH